MKRIVSLGVVGMLLLGLASSPVTGQDTDSVVQRMIRALGGKPALAGIKDQTFSGTFELISMGMDGTMTFYAKEPNMVRQDMEVMGMMITNAFDGEVGWMINPQTGTTEELPAEAMGESERGAIGFNYSALLDPAKFGIKWELKGKETVDDVECIVLTQTFADGHAMTHYLDTKTYLTYKTVDMALNQMGMEVEQEVFVSDYKKVDGIMFAHSILIMQDGEEFMSATITETKFNSGLEDSLFKMQ